MLMMSAPVIVQFMLHIEGGGLKPRRCAQSHRHARITRSRSERDALVLGSGVDGGCCEGLDRSVPLALSCFTIKEPVWSFGIARKRLRMVEIPGKVGSAMTALEGALASVTAPGPARSGEGT